MPAMSDYVHSFLPLTHFPFLFNLFHFFLFLPMIQTKLGGDFSAVWPGLASTNRAATSRPCGRDLHRKIGRRLLGRVAGVCIGKSVGDLSAVWPGFASKNWAATSRPCGRDLHQKIGRQLLVRVAGICIKKNWGNYANCAANAMFVHLGPYCPFCEPVHAARFTRFTLFSM